MLGELDELIRENLVLEKRGNNKKHVILNIRRKPDIMREIEGL